MNLNVDINYQTLTYIIALYCSPGNKLGIMAAPRESARAY